MPAYTTETVDTSGRRQVVATVFFILAALVVSYLPASTQQHVAASLRSTVLRPFVTTQEAITGARTRAVDVDQLRQRLDSLVAAKTAEGPLAEENRRLRAMLDLSQKLGPTFAAATLVRAGTTGSESTFLVDVGSSNGIHTDAPVISAQGLLGVIRDVRADQSIGMDWTHPDFRASAMTADGSTYGVVESRRGVFREEDRLVLNGTAFHTRLEDGTVVVTSGLGGVFPRGVPIGLVNGLAEGEGGWRKSYWLRPLAEPGVATHVLVAVGNAGEGPMDLSPVWPADSVFTEDQLAERERVRVDSLTALGDSLAQMTLRVAVLSGDSARALQAVRQDSLRLMVARRAQSDSLASLSARTTLPGGPAGGAGAAPRPRPAAQNTAAPANQPAEPAPGQPTDQPFGPPVPPVTVPPTDTIRIGR